MLYLNKQRKNLLVDSKQTKYFSQNNTTIKIPVKG